MSQNIPDDNTIAAMLKDAVQAYSPPPGTKQAVKATLMAKLASPRRVWIRLTKIAAAAVICLAVVGLWWLSTGPDMASSAYAELLEAVDNTKAAEWVYMRVISGDKDEEVWMSFNPYRVFAKRGGRVDAVDLQAGRRWEYDPATRTVAVFNVIDKNDARSRADNFLDFVMSEMKRPRSSKDMEILRGEVSIDGAKFTTLTSRRRGSAGYIRCTIDPRQNRIVRIKVLEDSAAQTTGVPTVRELKYPESGPDDIYALGVPRDAKIVNDMPGWNIVKIGNAVTKARRAFLSKYYAIVAKYTLVEGTDKFLLAEVQLVYKKGSQCRVERYLAAAPGERAGDMEAVIQVTPNGEDAAALEAWTQKRPLWEIFLCPEDPRHRVTMKRFHHPSWPKPKQFSRSIISTFEVERYLWPKSLESPFEHKILGETEGDFGRLIGVETIIKGRIVKRLPQPFWPRKTIIHLNRDRDWIMERSKTIMDPRAPWRKDEDWLKSIEAVEIPPVSTWSWQVTKYAQTVQGHWYPRQLSETYEHAGMVPGDSYSRKTRIFVHLDTARDIPDKLFDPQSVVRSDFPAR